MAVRMFVPSMADSGGGSGDDDDFSFDVTGDFLISYFAFHFFSQAEMSFRDAAACCPMTESAVTTVAPGHSFAISAGHRPRPPPPCVMNGAIRLPEKS